MLGVLAKQFQLSIEQASKQSNMADLPLMLAVMGAAVLFDAHRQQAILHYWCAWASSVVSRTPWVPALDVPRRFVLAFLHAEREDTRVRIYSQLFMESRAPYIGSGPSVFCSEYVIIAGPGQVGHAARAQDPRTIQPAGIIAAILGLPQSNEDAYLALQVSLNTLVTSAFAIARKLVKHHRRRQRTVG